MAYYYLDHEQCDDYAVTPVLATPHRTLRYCEEAPESSPYLPSCQKPITYCYERKPEKVIYCNEKKPKKVMYCSEKKPEKVVYCSKGKPEKLYCTEKKPHKVMYCCEKEPQKVTYGCEKLSPCEECCFTSAKKQPQKPNLKPSLYNDCESNCKPVKTKYIIPCYRYEDGRIQNQPTVLMHRACEVAYGERARRKPFITSSYHADLDHEIRRFHSEDDKGNCCFHFERKKPESCVPPDHIYRPCFPAGLNVSSLGCEYVQCAATDQYGVSSCYYYS